MYLAYGQSASPIPNPPTLETDALPFRWSGACPMNLFLKIREMARIAGLLLALARMGCLRVFAVLSKREARSCGRPFPFSGRLVLTHVKLPKIRESSSARSAGVVQRALTDAPAELRVAIGNTN